jgi:DNA polymerase-3 subunit epsilon
VNDYLLFIDTEASGLPVKWDKPYSTEGNWPFAVQIAWMVYTKNGEKVKQENHYINNIDFTTTPAAHKVHGISDEFRTERGSSRNTVMNLLAADLAQYNPMVVGHFMELDFHITGAEFYRTGIANIMSVQPLFCTMQATAYLVRDPQVKHLRLGELYSILFNAALDNQHDALADATATAACFFELVKRGDFTEQKITQQQALLAKATTAATRAGWGMALILAGGGLTALIAYLA